MLSKARKKQWKNPQGPCVVRWRFTDNGQAGMAGKDLTAEAWKKLPTGVKFITWQMEKAPETGHLHLQGYLELNNSQYVSYLHKKVSATAAFFVANATGEQNCGYVHKEKSREAGPWTLGQMGKANKQGGFKDFVKAVHEGARLRQLIYTHPSMIARYRSFYWAIREQMMPERAPNTAPQVILALGKTGSGKSRYGYETWRHDKDGYWPMPVNNGTVWFDGYDDHAVAHWDESSGKFSSMKLTALLQYLDRYPILVPVKGGHTWWMPRIIYLTTNIHPVNWYDYVGREDQRDALKRRFTKVLDFDQKDMLGQPKQIKLRDWDWSKATGFELVEDDTFFGCRRIETWHTRSESSERSDYSKKKHKQCYTPINKIYLNK